jgi:hypothetical protein
MKIRFAFLLVMVGLLATVGSCSNRPLNPLNPCTINGVVQNVPVNPQRALDVLFIIDDSPSMEEEQSKLAEQVPRLVNLLLTGGEADPDAVGTFPAVESLHVGIITPDLGHSTEPPHSFTAGVEFTPTPACELNNGNGKAGLMQVTGLIDDDGDPGTDRVTCVAQTPPPGTSYLDRPADADMSFDAQFVNDVECVTGQTDGCGFEQQLESILAQGRNGANVGFSRQGALLAVILITDEDDCSTTDDPRIFDTVPNPGDPTTHPGNPFQGPFTTDGYVQFNLRCWAHSQALQAIGRYVTGIGELKDDPSQVVFAAITGIPEDSALDGANFLTDEDRYQAILDHADMVETPDPDDRVDTFDQRLRPACGAGSADGAAVPGRRIVETAKGLAAANIGTVVESICASDYAPALNAIVDRIAEALRDLCLPRPLIRNSQNLVGCEVREVEPEGVTCADVGLGREPQPVGNEDGRDVCRITQLPSDGSTVPVGLGWFYDDFTPGTLEACSFCDVEDPECLPDQQQVSFTVGSEPLAGTRIRFECLQTSPPQDVDIGWQCGSLADCARSAESLREQYDRDNLSLACDPDTNTCQLSCTNNAECPGGFSCFDASGDDTSYCVNPTCTLN